jgi:DNA-binding transcriptional ArsR family regulator
MGQEQKAMATKKKRIRRITRYADMLSAMGTEPSAHHAATSLGPSEGMVVGEIGNELQIPSSTLSHHLEKLKNEGLVRVRRESTFLWYSANADALQELWGSFMPRLHPKTKAIEPQQITTAAKEKPAMSIDVREVVKKKYGQAPYVSRMRES